MAVVSTARRLSSAPSVKERLRAEIAEISDQIDHRLGNPPGGAHRAIYFWYWPPDSVSSISVLETLRDDAVAFAADLGIIRGGGALTASPEIRFPSPREEFATTTSSRN